MIYLLHGDNQVESRKKLTDIIEQAKEERKEIIKLEGLKVNFNQILISLESASLFGQEKLVVIENLLSRPKSKEKEKIIKYLKKETIAPDLVLWEKKGISGTTLRWFPKNWQIQLFKTPVIIFRFLDSIRPSNTREMLILLKEAVKKESPELIFYMLARQIRLLILAKDLGKKGLSGAPWQIAKLLRQTSSFTLKQLTNIYQKLLKIDIDIKTGQSLMPLDWHLDLLVAAF